MRLRGAVETVSGVDPAVIGAVHDPDFISGEWADLTPGGVLVSSDVADALGVEAGDTVPGRFVLGGQREFRIDGVFDQAIFSDVFVTLSDYEEGYPVQQDQAVFANAASEDGFAESQAAIEQALAPFPLVSVENQEQFKQAQQDQINQLLGIVFALLALTIIIAIFGIVNTLALTIYERTREIGLLRAVGLSARQARAMVRWESVIVALIGGLLGTVLGVVFGVWLADSIPDLTAVSIPWINLLVFLVLAGVAGVLAAIAPARRAARLDVLKAISQE